MKRATIVDGKVVLAEPNHDDPEGTTVATIDIKDQVCTIRLLEEDRSLGRPARYTIDHLGGKWSDAVAGGAGRTVSAMVR